MAANGTTLAVQTVGYAGSTPSKYLTFPHTDASGTGAQKTLANGTLVGNTTHSRTGEYSPLGRNIADAGPYITLNTEPPPDEGGVDLFGSGAGYRPGRNSYSIDGLTVPEDDFRRAIDSGAIGGAFGLLQISARMSAPRYTVYDRWGEEVYSGTDWATTRTAAYQTETLTAYRTINDSWSVIGLLATQWQNCPNPPCTPPKPKPPVIVVAKKRPQKRDCNKEAGLSGANAVSQEAANLIVATSNSEGVTDVALAVTLRFETGFYSLTNTAPNRNEDEKGNPAPIEGWDYGPFHTNYNQTQFFSGRKNRGFNMADIPNAYGNLGAENFNGSVMDNARLAARMLLANGGSEENQVKWYPGTENMPDRLANYNQFAPLYRKFFECWRAIMR